MNAFIFLSSIKPNPLSLPSIKLAFFSSISLIFHLSFLLLNPYSNMDSNPYLNVIFVDLLQSQQNSGIGLESSLIPLFGTQGTEASNFEQDTPVERKERRSWMPTDDVVLISSWLNTSKDVVVRNEQTSVAFWKRNSRLLFC